MTGVQTCALPISNEIEVDVNEAYIARRYQHRAASNCEENYHDAWSYALISRVFSGEAAGLTRDDVLDNITITWLTNTAISGARLYWESKLPYFSVKGVSIPVAVSAFPDEIDLCPRSWAERAYPKLIHYNKLDKGGHFAAWEQPKLFSEEVRAGFRSLRK